ncbi:MAG: hypothetical protein OHK0052_08790 [Anaerolineales bacterium]
MKPDLTRDSAYFLQVQTQTAWGKVLQDFAEWCHPKSGWRALDVGCGPGLLPALLGLQGIQAIGVDLDPQAFAPKPLHPQLLTADVHALPFAPAQFNLITAVNLLFLLPEPLAPLRELTRLLLPGGTLALLNPSERMSLTAATALADARGLHGLARDSLLNWATRAETHFRWDESALRDLLTATGLRFERTDLRIGNGLARLACGILP